MQTWVRDSFASKNAIVIPLISSIYEGFKINNNCTTLETLLLLLFTNKLRQFIILMESIFPEWTNLIPESSPAGLDVSTVKISLQPKYLPTPRAPPPQAPVFTTAISFRKNLKFLPTFTVYSCSIYFTLCSENCMDLANDDKNNNIDTNNNNTTDDNNNWGNREDLAGHNPSIHSLLRETSDFRPSRTARFLPRLQ